MDQLADFGLIGLAVMGQNLVLNINDHGCSVIVFNRTVAVVDQFLREAARGRSTIRGAHTVAELAAGLKRPRKIMLLVKAGEAVDRTIELLLPHLQPGDCIIDDGNSHFTDTIRRAKALEAKGLLFIGTGVSGGEEGARHGPLIMPGGNPRAWPLVKEIFQKERGKVAMTGRMSGRRRQVPRAVAQAPARAVRIRWAGIARKREGRWRCSCHRFFFRFPGRRWTSCTEHSAGEGLSARYSLCTLVRVAVNRGIRVIPVRGSTEKSGHRLDPSRLETVRVAGNAEIAPGIYRLSFPRTWEFVPGQSIALTLEPRLPARFYSIASGSRDALVEVLYDLVPDGELTPRLALLAPGDELLCSAPFGAFRDADGPSCWVATGTGIAPFVSMARSGGTEGKLLLHGSRTVAGLMERDLFSSLLNGRYVPCCTREKGEGVFEGRPTAWLSTRSLPAAERFLLCGNSRMVVDARDILIGRGVKFADVIAEIYF